MFVVAGESLIDLVARPDGSYQPVPGGGPYNFARALALQGVPTGYANPFSEDSFGDLLRQTLQAAGAHHLGQISSKPTALALVTTDARGQPQYSFYREGVADRTIDPAALLRAISADTLGFHTGALALVPPDDAGMMEVVRHCRGHGCLCTVDVNMRPQIAQTLGIGASRYRDAALAVLSAAHVAKVSDEDLHHLGFSGAPQVAARALLHRGCRLVVLTLGAEGAWAIGPEEQVFEPAQAVDARRHRRCRRLLLRRLHRVAAAPGQRWANCATAHRRPGAGASAAPCGRLRRHQHRAQRLPAADLG